MLASKPYVFYGEASQIGVHCCQARKSSKGWNWVPCNTVCWPPIPNSSWLLSLVEQHTIISRVMVHGLGMASACYAKLGQEHQYILHDGCRVAQNELLCLCAVRLAKANTIGWQSKNIEP
jgi:hypothetical protein